MATSKVQICNRALQKLGASRIESLSQDHPNARSMALAYDPVRERLLRAHPWSFAIVRTSVAADANDPVWGDWNRYTLPGDFLRLLRNDETGVRVDWQIEGDYILSRDSAPLEFMYVSNITTPATFDATFREALSCALAMETCEEITQSTGKLQGLQMQMKQIMDEAKRNNAWGKDSDQPVEDDWILARL